jgi:hypothetical protein
MWYEVDLLISLWSSCLVVDRVSLLYLLIVDAPLLSIYELS